MAIALKDLKVGDPKAHALLTIKTLDPLLRRRGWAYGGGGKKIWECKLLLNAYLASGTPIPPDSPALYGISEEEKKLVAAAANPGESGVPLARLPELFTKASRAEVCCSLHFNAGCESYDVRIDSPAPNERHLTRDYGDPDMAIGAGIEWLDKLIPA